MFSHKRERARSAAKQAGAGAGAGAGAAGGGTGAGAEPLWRRDAEKAGPLRVLEWGGVARAAASWAKRWGALHRGHLYLLERQHAPAPLASANVWLNKRAIVWGCAARAGRAGEGRACISQPAWAGLGASFPGMPPGRAGPRTALKVLRQLCTQP